MQRVGRRRLAPRFGRARRALSALAIASMLVPSAAFAQAPAANPATAAAEASARPDLAQAERMLLDGRFEQAWALLSPHEFSLAGDQDFDYLLGVAALETGRADLATLIFERVLAVNPGHAAARLDMGRAYFALGDTQRARTEFASVMQFNPPPAARATIERYLGLIDQREARARLRISGYMEGSVGTDSNVNSATSQSALFIPLFGANFTLAATSVQSRDDFVALAGGLEATVATDTPGLSLLAGLDLRHRSHGRLGSFDSLSTDGRMGLQWTRDRLTLRALGLRSDYVLDERGYRRGGGLVVDARYAYDRRTQLAVFGQHVATRYTQAAARSNSSNLQMFGVGVARTLDEARRSVLVVSAFRGDDVATDGRTDGDRRLWGLRAGYQRALAASADWFASLSAQKSTYSLRNALFAATRRDMQYDVSAGINWMFRRDWSLRPQISFTRNDSNLSLNDFERHEFSVTLRHDWR